jgi:hypothetical protein
MADLLSLDSDPFSAGRGRRRPANPGLGNTAVPRTNTFTFPGTQPSASSTASPGFVPADPGSIAPPPTEFPVPAAPNYNSLGQYANKLRGYDMSKFAQPFEQWDEKYRIGAVQSHFDPLKGVNDDFLNAIRSLGLAGGVSGSGDKLGFTDPRNSQRVRMGTGGTGDVVYGLDGQNADTAWQPWFVDDGANGGDPTTSGDPLAALLALLGRSGGTSPHPYDGDTATHGPDMSWLGPLLESLTRGGMRTQEFRDTNNNGTDDRDEGVYGAAPYLPSASTAQPTFQGGYAETPMAGGGDVSRAMQLLGMNMNRAVPRNTVAPTENPLVAQLRRLAGVQ